MGLNIGLTIKSDYKDHPVNWDDPSPAKLEEDLILFLTEKFPQGGFTPSVRYIAEKNEFGIDVRMSGYGEKFKLGNDTMHKALFEFAIDNIPRVYDLDIYLYWNG